MCLFVLSLKNGRLAQIQSREGKCLLREEVSGKARSAFAQAGCSAGSI
jgi:hypothetical protein